MTGESRRKQQVLGAWQTLRRRVRRGLARLPHLRPIRWLETFWKNQRHGSGPSATVVVVSLIGATVIFYILLLLARFGSIDGDDLQYPQHAMTTSKFIASPGDPLPQTSSNAERTCAPSQTVLVVRHIIKVLVEHNTWCPGDPQYKLGYFGLVSFEAGPFFDNKASFQLGSLRAVRRLSIELADQLGRARGTSAFDEDLQDARGALHWNERAWLFNPFQARVPLFAASAASSYRNATRRLERYNDRLVACEALFDPRSDNLFNLLDRIANDLGGMTDRLATRSKGERWSVEDKAMKPAAGNNRGIFDFRADNLFYEAHGLMWAYHGILQGLRVDFGNTVNQSNLGKIWDRMERHVAETAVLEPMVVSNGREDALLQPDHLSTMAVNMLRARANMTELRDILNR